MSYEVFPMAIDVFEMACAYIKKNKPIEREKSKDIEN